MSACYARALARLRIWLAGTGSAVPPQQRVVVTAPPAATWPFLHPLEVRWPSQPAVLWVPDLDEAFVNRQTAGTRLVTTQAAYVMQAWLDAIGDRDVVIAAVGDRDALAEYAPEIVDEQGLMERQRAHWPQEFDEVAPRDRETTTPYDPAEGRAALMRAFRVHAAPERLRLCLDALAQARTAPALVATASVCMEVNDLEAAARDLDEALRLAPQWAAAHFEQGKLRLRLDDMEGASAAFRAAAERMPRFGAAWSNLGATAGELDRPGEALEAFERALACHPNDPQALNNLAIVQRETGRLSESEAALRRVITLTPTLAFGHYNLGHTLFLQGRYQAALAAYIEGRKRDPERNPVQTSRLAMCKLATGDPVGAVAELEQAIRAQPATTRLPLLEESQSIVWALLSQHPVLPGWSQVNDWLTRERSRTIGAKVFEDRRAT